MERDPIDEGMAAALRLAQSENYLGNPEVVNGLLRRLALFAHSSAGDFTNGDEWAAHVSEEVKRLTAVFTGHNPDFVPVPAWNTDAQMLAEMQKRGATGNDAQAAVHGALMGMVSEFFTILNASASEEEATPKLDRLLNRYTNLFLGTAANR